MKGTSYKLPLKIYFVLDITSSMQPVIDTIKINIINFINKLKANDFDVLIGIVTFRDKLEEEL